MVSLTQNSNLLVRTALLLLNAFELTLFDHIEFVALSALVNHKIPLFEIPDHKSINQLEFLICLQRFEQSNLVQIAQIDVATAQCVLSNCVLKNIG